MGTRQVITDLIASHRVDVLAQLDVDFTASDMIQALRTGSIDVVEALRQHSVALPGQAIDLAAASGNISLVEYLYHEGYLATEDAIIAAVARGHFELVKHLVGRGIQPTYRTLSAAGAGGRVDTLEYLVDVMNTYRTFQSSDLDECQSEVGVPVDAYLDAIRGGHYEVVQWLLQYGPPANEDEAEYSMIDAAYGTGRLDLVELLRLHGYTDEPTTDALELAIDRGNVAMVKVLHRRLHYFNCECSQAAEKGYLDLLKYAHEHGQQIGDLELRLAAMAGQLMIVRWIIETFPIDNSGLAWGMAGAAQGGHLHIFEYLLNVMGDPGKLSILNVDDIATSAAYSGDVDLMKLVLETFEIPNLQRVIESAITSGRLEILKLLDPPTVSVDAGVVQAVIRGGYLRTLEFILDRGATLPPDSLESAFKADQLALVQYLLDRGFVIDRWYQCTSLELIRLLHLHQPTPGEEAIMDYIHTNNLSALAFIASKGAQFDTSQVDIAARLGHLDVVKLLYQYGARSGPGMDTWAASAGECELALFLERGE